MVQFYLTDRDRAKIAEAVRRTTTQPLPVPVRHTVPPDPVGARPPELYIAKLPTGGLPARIGTLAGHGLCDIYALYGQDTETLEFDLGQALVTGSDGLQVEVYNHYLRPWFGFSNYLTVYRDKFGRWLCQPPPTRYDAILNDRIISNGGSPVTARLFKLASGGWLDTTVDVDCVAFSLDSDEYFAQYQKGKIEWSEGAVDVDGVPVAAWVFDSTSCAVADDTGLYP